MIRRSLDRPLSVAAFLFLLAAAGNVVADGFIYVDVRRFPPPHPLPVVRPVPRPEFPMQVVRHRVEVRIDDTVARTKVDETFYNQNPFQMEGTYMFPLPPGA